MSLNIEHVRKQSARFAFDHFPHEMDGDINHEIGLCTDAGLRMSIERYFEELAEGALDTYLVHYHAERLGLHEAAAITDA